MFMLYQNINTTVSRYIYVLAGMIKEAMENHPFAKFEYSTKKDFYNPRNDKVIAIKKYVWRFNQQDEWHYKSSAERNGY